MIIALAKEIIKTKSETARLKIAKFEADALFASQVKNENANLAFAEAAKKVVKSEVAQ